MSSIENYLKSCCELRRFCSRDGWVDSESVRFAVVMRTGDGIIVDITFDELLLQGTHNRTIRVPCNGQLHLHTDRYGRIIRAEAL